MPNVKNSKQARPILSFIAPLMVLALACAPQQSNDAAVQDGAVGQDAAAASDAAADSGIAAYPAGPYGNQVGEVIPNFTFQGFFSPSRTTGLASAETWGAVSMDQFRRTGAKYLVIELGAFW
jgi:hypothetical protein